MRKLFATLLLLGLCCLSPLTSFAKADHTKNIVVKSGDTMSNILENAGISSRDSHAIINELKNVFPLNSLRPGQKLTLAFEKHPLHDTLEFSHLRIVVSNAKEVEVRRLNEDVLFTQTKDRFAKKKVAMASFSIEGSLYGSANSHGVPDRLTGELVKQLSHGVDFQRDIHKGDKLTILYETYYDDEDILAGYGDIIYASLEIKRKTINIYRFTTTDKKTAYYNEKGESVARSLLMTPVDGARISSGYGRRRHPVLGYTKMHKGIDFAAPRGTPIYAAGNGTIREIGRKGSYGKYIRISHIGNYSTAYAHLNRFAKGMRRGRKVSQGQIIGFVGTTGRSTGPHLHFEVLRGKRQINPRSMKVTSKKTLTGVEKGIFHQYTRQVSALLKSNGRYAQVESYKPN